MHRGVGRWSVIGDVGLQRPRRALNLAVEMHGWVVPIARPDALVLPRGPPAEVEAQVPRTVRQGIARRHVPAARTRRWDRVGPDPPSWVQHGAIELLAPTRLMQVVGEVCGPVVPREWQAIAPSGFLSIVVIVA